MFPLGHFGFKTMLNHHTQLDSRVQRGVIILHRYSKCTEEVTRTHSLIIIQPLNMISTVPTGPWTRVLNAVVLKVLRTHLQHDSQMRTCGGGVSD